VLWVRKKTASFFDSFLGKIAASLSAFYAGERRRELKTGLPGVGRINDLAKGHDFSRAESAAYTLGL
jgi:hypothetical protein